MLAVPEKPELNHPSSILYFKVKEIEAVAKELSARGVVFEAPPRMIAKMPDHELWMAFFRDSEKNILALMSEKPTNAGG
jgi:methylmalonyl-CoA/ethylmalonyl-CoA epimerase